MQHPYTRAMYPVRVVVRDPVNAEKSVTADYLTRNALPDLYEFAYSDGSKETLALSWDKSTPIPKPRFSIRARRRTARGEKRP